MKREARVVTFNCVMLIAAPLWAVNLPEQPISNLQESDKQPAPDQRGTVENPLVVRTISIPKSEKEAADEKADKEDISRSSWWMVALTGILGLMAFAQTIVFWVQAGRLKKTIEKMDEVAAGQTADMAKAIAESARSATAMEAVAEGVEKQVARAAEMAETQRSFWSKQMRAYISVVIGSAVYQETKRNLRFEGKPTLVNNGLTPAYKVNQIVKAAVLPFPLPAGHKFVLPPADMTSGAVVGPREHREVSGVVDNLLNEAEIADIKSANGKALYCWGIVNYEDMTGEAHFTKFCHLLTWRSDERIYGYYIDGENEAN